MSCRCRIGHSPSFTFILGTSAEEVKATFWLRGDLLITVVTLILTVPHCWPLFFFSTSPKSSVDKVKSSKYSLFAKCSKSSTSHNCFYLFLISCGRQSWTCNHQVPVSVTSLTRWMTVYFGALHSPQKSGQGVASHSCWDCSISCLAVESR